MGAALIPNTQTDPTTGWTATRTRKGSKCVITVQLAGQTVCTIGGARADRAAVVLLQHFLPGHGQGTSMEAWATRLHGKTNVEGVRADRYINDRHVSGEDRYGFVRDYLEWTVPVKDA